MLIHALGNAGHPNSLQHIISYTETNQGTPSLRRAAAYALRHFSCNKVQYENGSQPFLHYWQITLSAHWP